LLADNVFVALIGRRK